jgi:hypothetical protein
MSLSYPRGQTNYAEGSFNFNDQNLKLMRHQS